MNEELVEKRLKDIETKLDEIMKLVSQTQLQEHRLKELEKSDEKLKDTTLPAIMDRISKLENRAGNMAMKIVSWIAAAVATLLLGYIAVKVGIK